MYTDSLFYMGGGRVDAVIKFKFISLLIKQFSDLKFRFVKEW